MKLPNGDRAVVDIKKLRDYCLSFDHPRGRHKAQVFASALGLTAANIRDIKKALLSAAWRGEAVFSGHDEYGERFVVDFLMEGPTGRATVRSMWIVRRGEDFPRLATCYVL